VLCILNTNAALQAVSAGQILQCWERITEYGNTRIQQIRDTS
jgi:hypothetical protein